MNKIDLDIADLPDATVDVRKTFNIDVDMTVPAYSATNAYCPEIDPDYMFDKAADVGIIYSNPVHDYTEFVLEEMGLKQ